MIVTFKQHPRGPVLKLTFTISCRTDDTEIVTEPINIQDLALVRLKFKLDCYKKLEPHISYKRHEKANNSTVHLNVTCGAFVKDCVCIDDWIEFIYMKSDMNHDTKIKSSYNIYSYIAEVMVTVRDITCKSLYNKLFEDTKFTDFHLRAADGSVAVHKAVLGVHSDVLLTMLNGEWKETSEGYITMDGVTVQTLQHLKDYMYKRTLPDDQLQLQNLLLVAACYLVDDLKVKCMIKLVQTITPENFDALVEFAFQNNLPEFVKAIVIHIPDNVVNGIHRMTINEVSDGKVGK